MEEVFTKYAQKPSDATKVKSDGGEDEDDISIMDKLVGDDQPTLTKEKAQQALNEVLDAWNALPDSEQLSRLQKDHIDHAFEFYCKESADSEGHFNKLFASDFVRDVLKLSSLDESNMRERAAREHEKKTAAELLQREDDLE